MIRSCVRCSSLASVVLCLSLLGCGDEEPVAPTLRCADQGLASFGAGSLIVDAGKPGALEIDVSKAAGFLQGPTLVVRFPNASLPEGKRTLLLRVFTSDSGDALIDRISRATTDGPASFNVSDATAVKAGSNNIASLDGYDCDFANGKICAQLAVDRQADGLISDEDNVVFNARSGTIVFEKIDGLSSTFKLNFNLQLGANIFDRDDMTSSNAWSGCVDSGYESAGNGRWELR